MTLDELNRLDEPSARDAFHRCCGSLRWAHAMAAARPFSSVGHMQRRGHEIWESLGDSDVREAFAAHPTIGDARPASAWSAAEQRGMASADDDTKMRLRRLNAEYEARFGYIFIVCATGKTASEMLALLDARMTNDRRTELNIAAEEQRKITDLRLAKLVDGPA